MNVEVVKSEKRKKSLARRKKKEDIMLYSRRLWSVDLSIVYIGIIIMLYSSLGNMIMKVVKITPTHKASDEEEFVFHHLYSLCIV